MGPGVVGQLVPLVGHAPEQRRVAVDVLSAHEEERGGDLLLLQDVQQPRGVLARAGVEGECHALRLAAVDGAEAGVDVGGAHAARGGRVRPSATPRCHEQGRRRTQCGRRPGTRSRISSSSALESTPCSTTPPPPSSSTDRSWRPPRRSASAGASTANARCRSPPGNCPSWPPAGAWSGPGSPPPDLDAVSYSFDPALARPAADQGLDDPWDPLRLEYARRAPSSEERRGGKARGARARCGRVQ